MVRIVDLPTAGTVDSNTYVPVFQNGKTKKASAASFGGGSGSVSDQIQSATVKSTPDDADELGYLDSGDAFSLVKMTWANLKTWLSSLFVSKSGDTINGDLNFSGAARRITGDFSNATIADRLLFQSNVPNGTTAVFAIPNGTEVISNFSATNSSNPANAAIAQMAALGGEVRFSSFASGSGTAVPMTFHVGAGGERLRIDTSGNVFVQSGSLICGNGQTSAFPPAAIAASPTTHATSKRAAISVGAWIIGQDSAGNGTRDFFLYDSLAGAQRLNIGTDGNVLATSGALGYGAGTGGTVVQATNKSASVTLNKVCGQITMHNAALSGGAAVRFTMNNTFVGETDEVSVWLINPVNPSAYDVAVDGMGSGVCAIRLRNNTSTSYADSVVIGFSVRKVVTS